MADTLKNLPTSDLEQYLLDNYGRCSNSVCRCLKDGWIGTLCPYWVPLGVRSFEQLKEKALEQYNGPSWQNKRSETSS
jgi:hypothetical protein